MGGEFGIFEGAASTIIYEGKLNPGSVMLTAKTAMDVKSPGSNSIPYLLEQQPDALDPVFNLLLLES